MQPSSSERGSAVLIVLVLLAAMALIALSNSDTLDHLNKELKLVEQQQLQRHGQGAGH